MRPSELLANIKKGELFANAGVTRDPAKRFGALLEEFIERYGDERDVNLFSVPGRSELAGNHTDHNHGRVIACSVDLDIVAVVAAREDSTVRIKSEGFPEDVVDINEYVTPREDRFGHSDSLIAGVADGFRKRGLAVGGFDAVTSSNVLKGSGISSSAAFEDMVGTIMSHLYCDGSVDFVKIAMISQYAENAFFGKPCGLMDQVACAAGGVVAIDFADPTAPVVEKINFDLTGKGYRLCIVNTGGNRADLTPDYAAVPAEMKSVAKALGHEVLRECDEDAIIAAIPTLRSTLGDRAILRALHFMAENRRVYEMKQALLADDFEAYFDGVMASGHSSFCYLQNVYTTKNITEQGLSLALNLSERYLKDCKRPTAFRVHGGGFAGTIHAYVPDEDVEGYRALMDGVFGEGACHILSIRPEGAVKLL